MPYAIIDTEEELEAFLKAQTLPPTLEAQLRDAIRKAWVATTPAPTLTEVTDGGTTPPSGHSD